MVSRKIKRYLPLGTLIVIVSSMVGWGLHKLAFLGVASLLPGYSEFAQVAIIVGAGIFMLLLLGISFKKILK